MFRTDLDVVDSTNAYAASLLKQKELPEGALITAREQRKGRGQWGTSWQSTPDKDLTVSFVFYPFFIPAERQFDLSKALSLGVSDTLKEFLDQRREVMVKWPNDVMVDGRKVAGLLIENWLRNSVLSSSVVGIGVNVGGEGHEAYGGISLDRATGKRNSMEEVLLALCSHLEKRYLQLKRGERKEQHELYLERLFLRNTWADYLWKDIPLRAKIVDVDPTGRLILEKEGGGYLDCSIKELAFRN